MLSMTVVVGVWKKDMNEVLVIMYLQYQAT